MSYSLKFVTGGNLALFSFTGISVEGDRTVFERPQILTYFQVSTKFYKNGEVSHSDPGILYPGVSVSSVYLENGVLTFLPEESPVDCVFTFAL